MSPFDTFLSRRPLREERDLTEDDTCVVQPDLLVLCNHADRIDDKYRYTGTPTLVVEIISPSTRSTDKVRKPDIVHQFMKESRNPEDLRPIDGFEASATNQEPTVRFS